MSNHFSTIMSELRHKAGLSQRRAASDLKISQALLSHYENGAREPGLDFVCRACDYYNVSADYLLGRSDSADDQAQKLATIAANLRQLADALESEDTK
jgi:transcriptional regulator with XRE-family HTH domain